MKTCSLLEQAEKKYKNRYIILFSEKVNAYCVYNSGDKEFIGTVSKEDLLNIENITFPTKNDKGTPIKYLCPFSSENSMKLRYINDIIKEYKFNELIENFNYLLNECWDEGNYVLFYGNNRFIIPVNTLSLEGCKEEILRIARIVAIHLLAKVYPSYANIITTFEGESKAYLVDKVQKEKLVKELEDALEYLKRL